MSIGVNDFCRFLSLKFLVRPGSQTVFIGKMTIPVHSVWPLHFDIVSFHNVT